MKKLVFFLLFIPQIIYSRDSTLYFSDYFHGFALGAGANFTTKLQDFNQELSGNDILEISPLTAQFSANFRFKFGQHYAGATFNQFTYFNRRLEGGFGVSFQTYVINLDYNYDFLKKKKRSTFELGLSVGNMSCDMIAIPGDSTITQSEFFEGKTNTVYIRPKSIFTLTPSLQTHIPISKKRNIWWYLKGGYFFSLNRFEWDSPSLQIENFNSAFLETGLRFRWK